MRPLILFVTLLLFVACKTPSATGANNSTQPPPRDFGPIPPAVPFAYHVSLRDTEWKKTTIHPFDEYVTVATYYNSPTGPFAIKMGDNVLESKDGKPLRVYVQTEPKGQQQTTANAPVFTVKDNTELEVKVFNPPGMSDKSPDHLDVILGETPLYGPVNGGLPPPINGGGPTPTPKSGVIRLH